MRKVLLLLITLAVLPSFGQDAMIKYGYLSYEDVLSAMPEYVLAQRNLSELRGQYEAEQKRVEDEFNRKYEEFLDGQASYPKAILQKRQSELQDMLNRNVAFKRQSQELLKEAETKMMEGLKARISEALTAIGQQRGYAFILNTDKDSVPFVNTSMGEDVTGAVLQFLSER